MPLEIACDSHGISPYCVICKHLREQTGLGYFAIEAEPQAPAQAWCEKCGKILERQQGWDDVADAQAEWELFCTACYENTLSLHQLISWCEGTAPDE